MATRDTALLSVKTLSAIVIEASLYYCITAPICPLYPLNMLLPTSTLDCPNVMATLLMLSDLEPLLSSILKSLLMINTS